MPHWEPHVVSPEPERYVATVENVHPLSLMANMKHEKDLFEDGFPFMGKKCGNIFPCVLQVGFFCYFKINSVCFNPIVF